MHKIPKPSWNKTNPIQEFTLTWGSLLIHTNQEYVTSTKIDRNVVAKGERVQKQRCKHTADWFPTKAQQQSHDDKAIISTKGAEKLYVLVRHSEL